MTPPTATAPAASRLVRPGLLLGAGGLILSGAALAWLAHPAWAVLTVLGGLALMAVPDPAA